MKPFAAQLIKISLLAVPLTLGSASFTAESATASTIAGNGGPGFASFNGTVSDPPPSGVGDTAADDFTLNGLQTITGIEWWGFHTSRIQEDNFAFGLFEDLNGKPGELLPDQSQPLPNGFFTKLFDQTIAGIDLYKYSVDIAPLSLMPKKYWLAIINYTIADNWFWAWHAPSGTFAVTDGSGTVSLEQADLAFNLTGNTTFTRLLADVSAADVSAADVSAADVSAADVVSVPEPASTLGFLALGILGAASTLKQKLNSSNKEKNENCCKQSETLALPLF